MLLEYDELIYLKGSTAALKAIKTIEEVMAFATGLGVTAKKPTSLYLDENVLTLNLPLSISFSRKQSSKENGSRDNFMKFV